MSLTDVQPLTLVVNLLFAGISIDNMGFEGDISLTYEKTLAYMSFAICSLHLNTFVGMGYNIKSN